MESIIFYHLHIKKTGLPEWKDVQDMDKDRSCLPRDNVDSASCTTRHWSRSWNFQENQRQEKEEDEEENENLEEMRSLVIKDEMHELKEKEEC